MNLIVDFAVSRRKGTLADSGVAATTALLGPEGSEHFGVLLAVAGLIGSAEEEDSAGNVIETLKKNYFFAPEFWSVGDILTTSFDAANQAVNTDVWSRQAVTLSSLVIKNRRWFIGHAGNNRVWLYRQGRLQQLTIDHAEPKIDSDPVITRACGLEKELKPEISSGELEEDDVFLITSESVHHQLDGGRIIGCMIHDRSATYMADTITQQAANAGSPVPVAAAVIRIGKVPASDTRDASGPEIPPVRSLPKLNQTLDGFTIIKRLRKGRLSHYYQATDRKKDKNVILKFPDPAHLSDTELINCFLRDEWLARRVDNVCIIRGQHVTPGRRSALYSVHAWQRGENLAQRLRKKRGLSIKEVLYISKQLLQFLQELHHDNILHRDIRPENIIFNKSERRIYVFGFDTHRITHLLRQGPKKAFSVLSPVYTAPESCDSPDADERIDIYSAGVTLYRLLTGKYPYGKVSTPGKINTRPFRPPEKYNKEIPASVSAALAIACDPERDMRFPSVREFLDALG